MVGNPQETGRARLVPLGVPHRLRDQPSTVRFNLFMQSSSPGHRRIVRPQTQSLEGDLPARVLIRGALDDILELAHVPQKAMSIEPLQRSAGDPPIPECRDLQRELIEEVAGEDLYI